MAKAPAAPIAWSNRLVITLVRGLPGTRALHRRTLQALGLRKCYRTIIRDNTPTIRGMINQVKRHLAVETEEMYLARLQKETEHKATRPPLVFRHSIPEPPRKLEGLQIAPNEN